MSHFRGRICSEVLEVGSHWARRGENLMVGVVFSEKEFWSWKSRRIHSASPMAMVLQNTKTQEETKGHGNPSKC